MEQHLPGLALLLTSIMLFSYWLIYCMGSPLADDRNKIDPGAIFFFFPAWLAKRRLSDELLLADIVKARKAELEVIGDPIGRWEVDQENARYRMETGRKFFTWERSILCPICLHWWLTVLIVALAFVFNWLQIREHAGAVVFIYLVNHFFIRKIS
jgi:hypothetical protein